MPTDLTVTVRNEPGALARLGEALGNAGINIEAIAAFGVGERGVGHLVVDDADRARSALEQAGFSVEAVKEALSTTLPNEPGALGAYARKLADAGVDVEAHYSVFGRDEVIFVVDDVEKARSAGG